MDPFELALAQAEQELREAESEMARLDQETDRLAALRDDATDRARALQELVECLRERVTGTKKERVAF